MKGTESGISSQLYFDAASWIFSDTSVRVFLRVLDERADPARSLVAGIRRDERLTGQDLGGVGDLFLALGDLAVELGDVLAGSDGQLSLRLQLGELLLLVGDFGLQAFLHALAVGN